MEVRKAVVTAAGLGTRFLPATKAQPKETLPVVDKPMIHYIVEEAAASGIEQIIIVTAAGKRAIEDYFDRSLELEAALEQQGDTAQLKAIRGISEMADICYVRQKSPLGLGHAVLTAKDLVDHEPFAVLLPDDIIDSREPVLKQMLAVYERFQSSIVAIEEVPREAIPGYGIIDPLAVEERLYKVRHMVEKPPIEKAPSNLGIVGRYVLTPEIFEALERAKPGARGEIQLTDGLALLLKRQSIYGYQFQGRRYDVGNPLGLLQASVELALRREDLGPRLLPWLKQLIMREAFKGS